MSSDGPVALIVRPEPGASAMVDRLATLGVSAIAAPSTEIRRTGRLDPRQLDDAQVVAFTSAAAARLAGEDLHAAAVRDLPALCVGAATAAAARAAGFRAVRSVDGTADDLAHALARLKRTDGSVVHIAGRDVSAVLSGLVAQISAPFGTSVKVHRIVIYAAERCAAPPDAARRALVEGRVGAAVFLSARAVEAFLRLLDPAERRAIRAAAGVVISERVAAAARTAQFRQLLVADKPDEDATIEAVLTALRP